MLSYSKHILQKLTGNLSLQDVGVETLQQLAEKYPYFGAAQFLLAKKLFTEKNPAFEAAVQKTALHFNNSLLFNFELEAEADNINNDAEVNETQNGVLIDSKNDDFATDIKDEVSVENKKQTSEDILNISNQNLLLATIHESEEESDDEESEIDAAQTTQVNEVINEKLSNLLKEQAAEFEKPLESSAKLEAENTPYHRIDYFDSQGIKLDAEKETDDKLGKRLRRFTDWLKEMKSINPNLTGVEPDAVGEIQAQNMAARSNEPKEIVTEAMAEVLIKQCKPEQAVRVYEKLSFSNPSKSAYFAAKIQELKGK